MSLDIDHLQHYIDNYSSEEDEVLHTLNRETHLKVVNPRMLSGQVQGKFLEFLSRMLEPETILEIGTYTGYSAICLARGLKDGGRLLTIELNEELNVYSRKYFEKAGLQHKIVQLNGDALKIIPGLTERFDLVFIDGEKTEYTAYYQQVFPKLNPGGFIVADNVLWGGKVIGPQEKDDPETLAIRNFNQYVKEDPAAENVILSIRDGLNIIRKK